MWVNFLLYRNFGILFCFCTKDATSTASDLDPASDISLSSPTHSLPLSFAELYLSLLKTSKPFLDVRARAPTSTD